MFEAKGSLSQLIEAAYYTMRALERRFTPEDLDREPIMAGLASEPSAEEQAIARHWIETIEQREGHPISELDGTTIQRYLEELSDTVQRRVELEVKPNLERGQQLLEKLWRDVPITTAAGVTAEP